MSQDPQQVIEAQRQDWNRVAAGWEKWDEMFDRSMAFLNHRLIADARLRQGQQVLDLGSGTGYPALLAAQVVRPQGQVVGIDLADDMLAAARRKAARLGLSNVEFRTGDVTTLPFPSGSFDAVTSRFCLMFLPEIPKAVAEIARVLKPGGHLAAAVWSAPEKNPYLRIPMDVIKQLIELPPPDPQAPGIFRLAKSGDLMGMIQQAGLSSLSEEEFVADVQLTSGREYFSSLMEIAAPIQNLFAKLSPSQQAEAEKRIVQSVEQYRRGEAVSLPIAARFVAAVKPT
ncbi:Methyltransferase domain-containing protein [Nitrospira tepida]|uniref:Methyltransferase domain-containing protein n=1 Tax=Nitrospira tepida TaxID=2973512 RepID=A0AA86N2C5_9BACT|nr:methyltransferase domain-containing protein [Nitrospira tepida]CAI4033384.1 Methyltransferase domain-containing protein [Nitrospira tepida]